MYFYSRPCGRGDAQLVGNDMAAALISTHAPAGGATPAERYVSGAVRVFLLTPLREGRPAFFKTIEKYRGHFYSRPCGRGDVMVNGKRETFIRISTHAPAGGATVRLADKYAVRSKISTHAPAGGATKRTVIA